MHIELTFLLGAAAKSQMLCPKPHAKCDPKMLGLGIWNDC